MTRFPSDIDLVGNVAAYQQRLNSKEEGTILFETFPLNKELAAADRPLFGGWVGKCDKLCEILNEQVNYMVTAAGKPTNIVY